MADLSRSARVTAGILTSIALFAGGVSHSGAQDSFTPPRVDRRDPPELVDLIRSLRGDKGVSGRRIIGGRRALPGEVSWQIGIVLAGEPGNTVYCGGALIAPDLAVTAAHCVPRHRVNDLAVIGGVLSLDDARQVRIARVEHHPRWGAGAAGVDLAYIRLSAPIATSTIDMASVAQEQTAFAQGLQASVSGWGNVGSQGEPARHLMVVDVPLVSRADCNDRVAYHGQITEDMICAGAEGRDSCLNDSGGPLTVQVGARRVLIGIVSRGAAHDLCGQANKPGVYTRIATLASWVRTCAGGGPCNN